MGTDGTSLPFERRSGEPVERRHSLGFMADGGLRGREWLAGLPEEVAAQRRMMTALVDRCERWPLVKSLIVGCSLGRGAGDALSDIDGALGVDPKDVIAMEEILVAALPEFGEVVDVLRHPAGPQRQWRRVFAQFADGMQLDLPVVDEANIRERLGNGGAPDFVVLYERASDVAVPAAYDVSADQIREWAFLGWCALIDLDKYLRRGSLWEAHDRLHDARHRIWALWAAANGAMYPWHGLSQVLDHDPSNLPPGIESTVACLDPSDLRRAARASATILTEVSQVAADRYRADLPTAMADYVSRALAAR
jgi:hypothetical protein